LAGDIGNPEQSHYREFLRQASKAFPTVLLISGNHEFYGHSITETDDLIHLAIKGLPNLHYLNCTAYDISPAIRVLGCTLWSFVPPEAHNLVSTHLSDYRAIYHTGHNDHITIDQLNAVHHRHVQWLEEQLEVARTEDKQVLLMTHHMPSFDLIHPKYKGNKTMLLINTAFATALDRLIADPVHTWVCGHTHTATRTVLNNVNVVINPTGYPHEKPTSDSALVIAVHPAQTSSPQLSE